MHEKHTARQPIMYFPLPELMGGIYPKSNNCASYLYEKACMPGKKIVQFETNFVFLKCSCHVLFVMKGGGGGEIYIFKKPNPEFWHMYIKNKIVNVVFRESLR